MTAALLFRPLQQLQAAPLLQRNQVRFLDSHSGTGGGIPGVGGARGLVEVVVDRLVEGLSRGDFDPDSGALGASGGSAGGAGEAGGGVSPMRGGGGAVSYDYDQVPRSVDIDAFRRALASALTEHAGAAGGKADAGGAAMAERLQAAGPEERRALAEEVARKVPDQDLIQMLSKDPVPVVRSRLAGMLERGGF